MRDDELPPNEDDEYARFEGFARKVVNTSKPKPSADGLPVPIGSGGEPADDGPEREEAHRDDR